MLIVSCIPVIQPPGHVTCLQEFPPVAGNDNSSVGEGDNQLENGITDQLISQPQLGNYRNI